MPRTIRRAKSLILIVFLLLAGCSSHEPVGTVLVYAIDSESSVDPASVVAAVDRRINPGRPMAEVKLDETNQVVVSVYGNLQRNVRRIEKLLAASGALEFRILANRIDHEALIDKASSSKAALVREGDEVVARWVPISSKTQVTDRLHDDPNLATRRNKAGKTEVLVVMDSDNVTGEFLKEVAPGVDDRGRPNLQFSLNGEGAKRFGSLTGMNLPDRITGFTRQLGIILNDRLHSAPNIQSQITDQGVITGDYTHEEVEDLAVLLNAGQLPARLRQVSKTPDPSKKR